MNNSKQLEKLSVIFGDERAEVLLSSDFNLWCNGHGICPREIEFYRKTAISLPSDSLSSQEIMRTRIVLNNLYADFIGEARNKIRMGGILPLPIFSSF